MVFPITSCNISNLFFKEFMLICANINLLGFLSLISCRSSKLCVKELGLSELRRLQDVFKTFSRHLQDVFVRRIFQDVLQLCLEDVFKDVLKTSWKAKICYTEDVFSTKTSSRRLQNMFTKTNVCWLRTLQWLLLNLEGFFYVTSDL